MYILIYLLGEIFESNDIKFTKINPDGSEWFFNDQPALRNFTRLLDFNRLSTSIFLGQSSPLKSIRDTEITGKDEVYAEIDLESIIFPKTLPSQVNIFT